jgi:hypothetical protein
MNLRQAIDRIPLRRLVRFRAHGALLGPISIEGVMIRRIMLLTVRHQLTSSKVIEIRRTPVLTCCQAQNSEGTCQAVCRIEGAWKKQANQGLVSLRCSDQNSRHLHVSIAQATEGEAQRGQAKKTKRFGGDRLTERNEFEPAKR